VGGGRKAYEMREWKKGRSGGGRKAREMRECKECIRKELRGIKNDRK
jgi:hypothetical protein